MDPVTITIMIALGAFVVGFGSMGIAFLVFNHNKHKESKNDAVQNATDMTLIRNTLEQVRESQRETKHTVDNIDSKLDNHTRDIIKLQGSDETQWRRIEADEKLTAEILRRLTQLEQSHNNYHNGLIVKEGTN